MGDILDTKANALASIDAGDAKNLGQKRQIVFIAPEGVLFQGLAIAMQNHMPAFDVTLTGELPDIETSAGDVRLVLLYVADKSRVIDHAFACRQRFDKAAIGLVIDQAVAGLHEGNLLFEERVQGVLPLCLKLDVWLAASALLATGGEYYPSFLTRPTASPPGKIAWPKAAPSRLEYDRLTQRERQVLELISQGYQNKLIANRMSLSEHTVKVHVHNLITKLHVSNRTQAAATFRSGLNARPRPAPAPPPEVISTDSFTDGPW
jgi:DNA-binding CsgD family transcriptional regulator